MDFWSGRPEIDFKESILVGWSLGGMLALAAAARAAPRMVSGVVTVAASPKFLAAADWPAGVPQELFDAVCAGTDDAVGTLRRFAGLELKGCAGGELRQHLKWLQTHAQQPAPDSVTLRAELDWLERLDLRQALCTLTLPVRHVLAEQDAVLPVACAQAIASLTGRPGEISVLADAPHALPLTHAPALAQVIGALWQRLRRRIPYFGPIESFTLFAVVAICQSPQFWRNGIPISCSSRRASSSVRAVVTTEMFMPRALSTLR